MIQVVRACNFFLARSLHKDSNQGGEAVMKKVLCSCCVLWRCSWFWARGTPQASAQAVYGSIFGTITDPSGAAVAGAKVTVTSASQGHDD